MIRLSQNASESYSKWLWHVRVSLTIHKSSQKELAVYLGIAEANLSRILSGRVIPSVTFYFGTEDFLTKISIENG